MGKPPLALAISRMVRKWPGRRAVPFVRVTTWANCSWAWRSKAPIRGCVKGSPPEMLMKKTRAAASSRTTRSKSACLITPVGRGWKKQYGQSRLHAPVTLTVAKSGAPGRFTGT
jgi:hypothetical protein